jgi:threonine aldolase
VYSIAEVRELAEFVHGEGLYLHMDGARIANAAVSLGCSLKEATFDLGVDVLSFGGTKNGILGGEVVVFSNSQFSKDFQFFRKQYMQLSSKMRFIAVQFETLLTQNLWKKNAENANRMAKLLAESLKTIPWVKIVYPVQANGIFAQIPKDFIAKIQEKYFFYVWNEERSEVRWMTSFDTSEEDIKSFVNFLKDVP